MEFIQKYAKIDGDDDSDDQMSHVGGDEVNYSDVEFIGDDEQNIQGQNVSDYRLVNVTKDLQEAQHDHSMPAEMGECLERESFVPESVSEVEYDDFNDFQKRIESLPRTLKRLRKIQKILFTMPFCLEPVMLC